MLNLTSTEYDRLKGPIACEIISNKQINNRQVLVVKIEPTLAGIDYGRGLRAINYLLLTAKYKDAEIKNLHKFPVDVVVFIPDNLEEPLKIKRTWSKMEAIGWAKLNETNSI